MIHVVAIIPAKPGRRAAILEAFHANLAAVRAEQGCIEYGPVIDAAGAGASQARLGDDTFMVLEKWESLQALDAHAQSPHMAAYGAKTEQWLAERVIHVLADT